VRHFATLAVVARPFFATLSIQCQRPSKDRSGVAKNLLLPALTLGAVTSIRPPHRTTTAPIFDGGHDGSNKDHNGLTTVYGTAPAKSFSALPVSLLTLTRTRTVAGNGQPLCWRHVRVVTNVRLGLLSAGTAAAGRKQKSRCRRQEREEKRMYGEVAKIKVRSRRDGGIKGCSVSACHTSPHRASLERRYCTLRIQPTSLLCISPACSQLKSVHVRDCGVARQPLCVLLELVSIAATQRCCCQYGTHAECICLMFTAYFAGCIHLDSAT
jgi:hypothetical protein